MGRAGREYLNGVSEWWGWGGVCLVLLPGGWRGVAMASNAASLNAVRETMDGGWRRRGHPVRGAAAGPRSRRTGSPRSLDSPGKSGPSAPALAPLRRLRGLEPALG